MNTQTLKRYRTSLFHQVSEQSDYVDLNIGLKVNLNRQLATFTLEVENCSVGIHIPLGEFGDLSDEDILRYTVRMAEVLLSKIGELL